MTKTQSFKLSLLAGALLGLSGCSLLMHSTYVRPDLPAADTYQTAGAQSGIKIQDQYWLLFADSKLNAVIHQSLQQNFDLRKSLTLIKQAQSELMLADSSLRPDLSAGLRAQAQRELDQGRSEVKSSGSNFDLTYNLDLFGKLSAQAKAAGFALKASAYDYLAVKLDTVNTAGAAYWQYAYAKAAVTLGEQEVADSARRLSLIQAQYNAGAADGLDLDLARVNDLQIKSELENRRNALNHAATALNAVQGLPADRMLEVSPLDAGILPPIDPEVPAKLLSRRPDLMALEERLKQSLSESDAANAAFFPDFTLSLSLEAGAMNTLGRILADPVGALGAALTLPFLNFNELKAMQQSALSAQELAELEFVQGYLLALQQVYDALSDLNYGKTTLLSSVKELSLAKSNYQRYDIRYRAGAAALSDFLDAADALRAAAIKNLEARRMYLTAQLNLMTVLGGGTDDKQALSLLEDLS